MPLGAATWPEAIERCDSRGGLIRARAIDCLTAQGWKPSSDGAEVTTLWISQGWEATLPDCRPVGARALPCSAVAVNRTSGGLCATSDACHHRHEFLCASRERLKHGMHY
jgi:hypothetical protein